MIADLAGKTALVTGGGMGIGEGIARMLAEQGADVAVADLSADSSAEVAAALPASRTIALALDVTSEESVRNAVARVLDEWEQLDILVNNAGVFAAPGREAEDRAEDWDATLEINLRGTVRCCEAAIPHMKARRHGKIINIGSTAGHSSRPPVSAYHVSKAAVLRYTKGLALGLAPFSINVNAVCPGAVWTRFHRQAILRRTDLDPELVKRDPEEAFNQFCARAFPMQRPQTVKEIGKAVAFLASDDARNITGQCLHVDGGAVVRD